jgi:ribonuclease-3
MFSSVKVYFSKDKPLYNSLKNILGFFPDNISLYKQAFRHSSAAQEVKKGVKDSNERLEYLGDAVLGAVVAEYLFKMFPYKDEGFLTKMRSKIVSRSQLNQLSVKLGFNKFIEASLERGSTSNSINGDAFEAVIGAIYIDKGYYTARTFILERVIKNHVDMDEVQNKETDYKSRLIEWAQREKKELRFVLVSEIGEGNDKQFLVSVTIDGESKGASQHFSKKKAEQFAAEKVCIELAI